jgi:hypothetical protein
MPERKVPAQMAAKEPIARIILEPAAKEADRKAGLAILIMEMSLRMHRRSVARIIGHRSLDQGAGGRLMTEFRQRHGVVTVEPPIVAIMGRQALQEIELILLAAGATGGADQAGLVGRDADDQCVARPGRDMAADRGKCGLRLASNQ